MDYRIREMLEWLVIVGMCYTLYYAADYVKKERINIFYSDCRDRLGAVPHNIKGRLYCLPKQIK